MAKLTHKAGARPHMRRMPKAHRGAVKLKKATTAAEPAPHDEMHMLRRFAYIRRVSGPSDLLHR